MTGLKAQNKMVLLFWVLISINALGVL